MRPLIGSPGGKYRVANKLVELIPEHKIYCEPFLGSGAVFFAKKPSEVEVLNDLDDYAFVLKFLRDADDKTIEKLKKMNWSSSEAIFNRLKNLKPKDDLERFRKFVYLTYNSYGAKRITFSYSDSVFNVNKFERIRERLQGVEIYQKDYKEIIKMFDSKETFFFLDPPYQKSWRTDFGKKQIDYEEFTEILKNLKGKFLLTYENIPEAREMFKDFNQKKMLHIRTFMTNRDERYYEYELLISNYPLEKYNIYSEPEIELPEFVLIPDFICQTGSSVYGLKNEPNDIDIVIRLPQGLFDYIYQHNRDLIDALYLKLQKIFSKYNKPLHFVPSFFGPDFDNIPLYDLVLRPKQDLEKVIIDEPEMKEFYQELRAATKEVQKQAEDSKKEDKIEMFRFFFPEKTNLSAVMQIKGKENYQPIIDWIEKNNAYGKCVGQKKYDGNRIIIFYDGNEFKFYSEDGREISNTKFPNSVKELGNLNGKSFILDTEFEIWKNGKKLNREDVAGYLHNKTDFNDNGAVFNIFDILYYNGEDIHNKNLFERLKILEELGIKQSTIEVPDPKYRLNRTPSFLITDKETLKQVIKKLSEAPASEGAMLKLDTPYSLKGYANNWLKVKNYETLRAIVLKVNKTKVPTVFNYEIGVSFKGDQNRFREEDIFEIDGKKYLHIGRTYNTTVKCKVGDIISIIFHTFNYYKDKNGKYSANTYEPVFEEKHPEEATPDYLEDVLEKAEVSGLLVKKFIEDLRHYNPSEVPDEVLRDDYRILLGWLSSNIKKYQRDLIVNKLKEIIKEIIKRECSVLQPDDYKGDLSGIVIDILKKLYFRGIFLKEPKAKEVIDGKRKLIVFSKPFENMLNKPLWLCDENFVYGLIKLK